jgi:hypothetical protein
MSSKLMSWKMEVISTISEAAQRWNAYWTSTRISASLNPHYCKLPPPIEQAPRKNGTIPAAEWAALNDGGAAPWRRVGPAAKGRTMPSCPAWLGRMTPGCSARWERTTPDHLRRFLRSGAARIPGQGHRSGSSGAALCRSVNNTWA